MLFFLCQFNTTLEDLDLSWNGLGEEGCRALGAALPHNHTLRELDLTSNRVSAMAVSLLLPGLLQNDTLTHINVCSPRSIPVNTWVLTCIYEEKKTYYSL